MEPDHGTAPEPDGTRHPAPVAPEHARNPVPEPLRRSVLEPLSVRGTDVSPEAPPAPGTRNLVPEGKIIHMGDQVREWVRAALVRVGTGERWHYDASLVMIPSGRGTMSTAYAITLFTPSPIVGHKPIGLVKVVSDFPSREEIRDMVSTAVAEARQARSAMITRTPDKP